MNKKFTAGLCTILGIIFMIISAIIFVATKTGWSGSASYKVSKIIFYLVLIIGASTFGISSPFFVWYLIKYKSKKSWDLEIEEKLKKIIADQKALEIHPPMPQTMAEKTNISEEIK